MNWKLWFTTLAQIAATGLSLAGQTALAKVFTRLGEAAQSNQNVEAHMATVQTNLDSGPLDQTDWDAVADSITSKQGRIDRA